ncbi:PilZ domain-containing protein [Microvirga calopogonii]|uniref:PilZ domain-containing protein n=1 Tax=Microvirga calopogonii TaxID=2078013 RepID=UPI000E0CDAB9
MRPALPERRSTERLPTSLEGWFASEATGTPTACRVSDLSAAGVRLVIPPSADVPLEFELAIPDAQALARVRLVWTDGVHYGVRFTE